MSIFSVELTKSVPCAIGTAATVEVAGIAALGDGGTLPAGVAAALAAPAPMIIILLIIYIN